jgi:D-arabinose 1-dehydrogenase-like Zn-dependent alcohol dehydrogenase
VSAVGAQVTRFTVGDTVGVGCLVDSCAHCASCSEGLEQYCENGMVGTYNGPTPDAPGHTLGGYSQRIVVKDDFVLRITHAPEQLAAVAPLLCAGITTYSPLRHWKVGPGSKVGIVGIGGLGHMLIGGIAETQEMLDFCAARGIVSEIELIPAQQINVAYERMLKSDVKYRFVIDSASLAK